MLSAGSVANMSDVYFIIFLKFFLAPDILICTTDLCKRFRARCAFSLVHSVSAEKLEKLKTHAKALSFQRRVEMQKFGLKRKKKYFFYTKDLVFKKYVENVYFYSIL